MFLGTNLRKLARCNRPSFHIIEVSFLGGIYPGQGADRAVYSGRLPYGWALGALTGAMATVIIISIVFIGTNTNWISSSPGVKGTYTIAPYSALWPRYGLDSMKYLHLNQATTRNKHKSHINGLDQPFSQPSLVATMIESRIIHYFRSNRGLFCHPCRCVDLGMNVQNVGRRK